MRKLLLSLSFLALACAGASAADYCTYDVNASNANRYTSYVTLSDGEHTYTADNLQSAGGQTLYFDKTDVVCTFEAGSTITLTNGYNDSWMHGFAYCDWNGDGTFDTTINSNHTLPEGSEVLDFSCLDCNSNDRGYNSKGQLVYSGVPNTHLSFTIPKDTPAGAYRFRFKIDWDDINPCPDLNRMQSSGLKKNDIATNGGIIVDMTIAIPAPEPRTITVKVADDCADLGTVAIINPATTGNSIETSDPVTVKATTTDDDAYFVNWTDESGKVLSENPEYIYNYFNDVVIIANFRQHYTVTVNDPQDGTTVMAPMGKIESGDKVDKGTEITVRCSVKEKELVSLLINEVEMIDLYNNGYTMTVNGPVIIEPTYEAPKFTLTIVTDGEGTVTVAEDYTDEGAPAGNTFADGEELEQDNSYYVIATPAKGWLVESFIIGDETSVENGKVVYEEYTYVYGKTVIFEYWVLGATTVSTKFAVDESAIESIGMDTVRDSEIYNLQGIRVAGESLTPGIYILRDSSSARKVYLK